MFEQVKDLLENSRVLQVLKEECGDEIYHLEIITTDGDIVHIYANEGGSLSISVVEIDRG